MTRSTDLRVDDYIEQLSEWQQEICRQESDSR